MESEESVSGFVVFWYFLHFVPEEQRSAPSEILKRLLKLDIHIHNIHCVSGRWNKFDNK